MTNQSHNIDTKTTITLSFFGILLGVLIGAGVLSGDDQGRVNLLFLLLLFAFLPALSLVLSLGLASLKLGGLTAVIVNSPLWSKDLLIIPAQFRFGRQRRVWLFFQSQVFSLAFALGNIFVFVLLLLGTDVNFVWRSTLLDATDLLPALNIIASPWLFWQDAQPSLELLEQSQNSRIIGEISAYSENWWQFILAAQLSYNVIPRVLLLLFARWQCAAASDLSPNLSTDEDQLERKSGNSDDASTLANIYYTLPGKYQLLDWSGAPAHCRDFIIKSFGKPSEYKVLSPLKPPEKPDSISIVVLVKSWNAPLGELKDILATFDDSDTKFILPLDWDESSINSPGPAHLKEWQRFAATLEHWMILQPGEHS